jgi:cyclase
VSIRLISKLDVKGKNLVKGLHFEGLRVLGDPATFSKFYFENGIDEIIYQDVVASLYERSSLDRLIQKVSKDIFIPFIVGGGIRDKYNVHTALASGADRIFLNTAALKKPEIINELSEIYGGSTIIISIEVNKVSNKYKCFYDYGREDSGIDLISWLKNIRSRGVGEIMIMSIDKDGTGDGFDLELAKIINEETDLPFIFGGGCGKTDHIMELLEISDPSGICLSSCLHYNAIKKNNLTIYRGIDSDGNFEFLKKNEKYKNFIDFDILAVKDFLRKRSK